MGLALQKTLSFILLIGIGLLLKQKIKSPEQLKGIKTLILSIALPATIFIALLKIKIDPSLLFLPALALLINFSMLYFSKITLKIQGYAKNTSAYRTLFLLIPSFAPGLSCLPFVLEYLGDEAFAHAALADVGNKIFVLIILYLLAMHWYYKIREASVKPSNTKRVKELLRSLIKEPINMVIALAILLLITGLNLASLPTFLQDAVSRMSALMTPMVLIFIGIAVKISKREFLPLLQILFWRSGIAFIQSSLLIFFLPFELSSSMVLLLVAFPQSACSFWPFAHMTAVNSLEGEKGRTFNLTLALNLLALSLPFSTMIILGIFSSGQYFTASINSLWAGLLLLTLASIPLLINWFKSKKFSSLTISSKLEIKEERPISEMH